MVECSAQVLLGECSSRVASMAPTALFLGRSDGFVVWSMGQWALDTRPWTVRLRTVWWLERVDNARSFACFLVSYWTLARSESPGVKL